MHRFISGINPKYNNDIIRTFDYIYACDNIRLTDLINSLKKINVLLNLDDIVNFVKNNGDFIAHHNERFWKNFNQNNLNNVLIKL